METNAESAKRDLTDFFLEWRDTCAIDKCKRKEDVAYVHAIFDRKFREMAANPRQSKFGGLSAVSEFSLDFERTHAFHLVELEFYTPGKREHADKRFGQALKNYLFESSETKSNPGGINGYFLLMLKDVVKKSFLQSGVESTPSLQKDEEGNEIGELAKVGNQPANPECIIDRDPAQLMVLEECHEEFKSRFGAMWDTLGKEERLALLCDIFFISKLNPEIIAASGLGKSAFYNRKPLVKVREIANAMLAGYEIDELVHVFRNGIGKVAYDLGKKDPDCISAISLIEREGLVGGLAI